jgi:hypothetical protein
MANLAFSTVGYPSTAVSLLPIAESRQRAADLAGRNEKMGEMGGRASESFLAQTVVPG